MGIKYGLFLTMGNAGFMPSTERLGTSGSKASGFTAGFRVWGSGL